MELSKIVLIFFTVVTRSISSLQTCPEKSIWNVSKCTCDLRRGYFGEDPNKCDQKNCSDGFLLTRNGTCKHCTADDDVESCYKNKRQTSNNTLTTSLIVVSILFAILVIACIIVLIIFILSKRGRRKRNRNTASRSSPLLSRRRNHQESSSERNSSVYSYADTSVIGLSYRDVSNSSNLINRLNLPEMDETKEHSFSSPDVTSSDITPSGDRRSNSNPFVASQQVNQSLSSWPTKQSGSNSDESCFNLERRVTNYISTNADRCTQVGTQTGSSLTLDSIDRCSTNKNVLSWNGEDVPDNRDLENENMEYHGPIFLPLSVPIYQTIEMENLLTDTTCMTTDLDDLSEDTELMKPFLDDLSSNQLNKKCQSDVSKDIEQNVTAANNDHHQNGDDYEAIQIPQEPRNSISNNAVTILGRLQTLILKKDSKLQRKTEETESLKEEVRRLQEGIEQKDKELQDIHQYLSGIMENFPHDRNSMEEICNDLQTSNEINLQTEDVKQDQPDTDIYYSRQSV
ncbi:CEP290 [Mytilus edulis]|uniref:CEP290 n=1 Tax=Mytilus edulis TaxID=6550 RepID=A0A8S3RDN0_MYTED|nr:CEP290 [Mytilus edulis]